MSWGYWGIVGGLLAMLATMFISFELVNPKTKDSHQAPGSRLDEPGEGVTQSAGGHRQAA